MNNYEESIDIQSLERFIDESFRGGRVCRELRLSAAEVQYLRTRYPRIIVSPLGPVRQPKSWYFVMVHPPETQDSPAGSV